MKVSATYARNVVMGYDVTVCATAEGEESISSVDTILDGFTIGSGGLDPDTQSYQRVFRQVGSYTPGAHHKLVVRVFDDKGNRRNYVVEWDD